MAPLSEPLSGLFYSQFSLHCHFCYLFYLLPFNSSHTQALRLHQHMLFCAPTSHLLDCLTSIWWFDFQTLASDTVPTSMMKSFTCWFLHAKLQLEERQIPMSVCLLVFLASWLLPLLLLFSSISPISYGQPSEDDAGVDSVNQAISHTHQRWGK